MHKAKLHNESFPVGMLISPKLKPLVNTYYQAARFTDDIADNPRTTSDEKLQQLAKIRQAFLQPDSGTDLIIIRGLGRLFVAEQLDASLFLDLITAFERDAVNQPIRIWEELIDYCRYSAAPVGRFMLAIHNESPSSYLPAENLCIILQLLNHLEGLKQDLSKLNRCYIPEDMLRQSDVRKTDLGLDITLPQVKKLLCGIMQKISKMQTDTKILPALIKNFRLRFEVCVILSLTNFVVQRTIKTDVLQNPPYPRRIDWIRALFKGLWQAVFCKYIRQGQIL